jgi:hypothetical protein
MYLVVFYVGEYVWVCGCVYKIENFRTLAKQFPPPLRSKKSKTSELSPLRRKLLRFAKQFPPPLRSNNNLAKPFCIVCAFPYSSQTRGPRTTKFSLADPLLHA